MTKQPPAARGSEDRAVLTCPGYCAQKLTTACGSGSSDSVRLRGAPEECFCRVRRRRPAWGAPGRAGGAATAGDFVLAQKVGQDTRAIQHYLGHRSIASTVRYTALAPDRFKGFWKD